MSRYFHAHHLTYAPARPPVATRYQAVHPHFITITDTRKQTGHVMTRDQAIKLALSCIGTRIQQLSVSANMFIMMKLRHASHPRRRR